MSKMTDNHIADDGKKVEEVIKALEFCSHCVCDDDKTETKCPYYNMPFCKNYLRKQSLDVINRQQAEIERLTINMNAYGLGMVREKERADTIRAEAIKEFAERLNKEAEKVEIDREGDFVEADDKIYDTVAIWCKTTSDNILKEMVVADDDR